MKVEQLMTREVKVCTESDTINRAAQLMWESDCGCIPVISANGDGKVVGMLTGRDITMAAYIRGKQLLAIPVRRPWRTRSSSAMPAMASARRKR